jgi:hypothetical protein
LQGVYQEQNECSPIEPVIWLNHLFTIVTVFHMILFGLIICGVCLLRKAEVPQRDTMIRMLCGLPVECS